MPRRSTSSRMWKPAGLRSGSLTCPGCILARASEKSSGRRSWLRQPIVPPCSAPGLEADAVGLERATEIGQRHVVRRGDALGRSVDLQVVYADARIARELQLRLVDDQALEHLALEHRPLGRGRVATLELALGL